MTFGKGGRAVNSVLGAAFGGGKYSAALQRR